MTFDLRADGSKARELFSSRCAKIKIIDFDTIQTPDAAIEKPLLGHLLGSSCQTLSVTEFFRIMRSADQGGDAR